MKTPFTIEDYIKTKRLGVPAVGYYAMLIARQLKAMGYVRSHMQVNGRRVRCWVKPGETPKHRFVQRLRKRIESDIL